MLPWLRSSALYVSMALTCAILLLSEVLSAIEYMTLMVTRAAERQPSGKNDDEWFTQLS